MKWIGQHIWDKISRFRNDVYLDSATAHGSDPDKFLAIDPDSNKVVYRTGTQVLSDIGGISATLTSEQVEDIVGAMFSGNTETNITATYQDGDGTIDLVSTDTNTQNTTSLSWVTSTDDVLLRNTTGGAGSGTQDIKIVAGSNITIDLTDSENVTLNAANTTYSAGSLLDLSTTTFNVDLSELTDGTAAIDGSQDELVYLDNSSQKRKLISEINLGQFNNDQSWTANAGTITSVRLTADDSLTITDATGSADFGIKGNGSTVTTEVDGTDIVINVGNASASAKGIVELATTGEADTGTDTARAVTPAGLRSHVAARYSYQYITCGFSATLTNQQWNYPSQNSPQYYLWNNTHAGSATPANVDTSTTITVDKFDYQAAYVIPLACKLIGFYGDIRHHGFSPNSVRPVFALFRNAELSDGSNSDITPTCVAFDKYDTSTGNKLNRSMKLTTTVDVDLAAGDLLYPAVGVDADGGTSGVSRGSFTIILKTLMP